jgi:hypothetical protein
MLDTIAFYEVRAAVVYPAVQNTAGLADQHVTVLADNITVPSQCNKIIGVYDGAALTVLAVPVYYAALSSPSLRATSLVQLSSIDSQATGAGVEYPGAGALPLGTSICYNDFKEAPIQLTPGEALQFLSATQAASAVETHRVLVFLTDGNIAPMPAGARIETVMADAAAAAVANVWSATAIVFQQALRAGTYAIVGMSAHGVTMTGARLVLGNQGARPGCIGQNGVLGTMAQPDIANGLFRYGRLGVWGTFTHTNPPVVEVLCQAADAAATMRFALDIVKIG